MERFTAVLGGDDGDAPVVEVPFDVMQRYGRARAPVRGTVNGADFRTTDAKRDDTRARRGEKALVMVRDGVRRP
ncbi:MAG: DUF1905 domain-containing protein [Thermoleophilaceae bacterium]|nr:DUF1905 domain-containing protein [Thermoleophilaceae bacterium]